MKNEKITDLLYQNEEEVIALSNKRGYIDSMSGILRLPLKNGFEMRMTFDWRCDGIQTEVTPLGELEVGGVDYFIEVYDTVDVFKGEFEHVQSITITEVQVEEIEQFILSIENNLLYDKIDLD